MTARCRGGCSPPRGERVVPSQAVIATAVPTGSAGPMERPTQHVRSRRRRVGTPAGPDSAKHSRRRRPCPGCGLVPAAGLAPGFRGRCEAAQLSQTGRMTQVLAVLVREHQQTLHPVVFVPGREPLAPDMSRSTQWTCSASTDSNDPVLALGARVIHPDGHRQFVQPGAVVFRDLQSGAVSRVVIPVSDAERGGFTANGAFVVPTATRLAHAAGARGGWLDLGCAGGGGPSAPGVSLRPASVCR